MKDAIVFVGDSHTEFGQWSELLGVPVVNRGVAGDTTAQVLERLDGVTRLRPKIVFLMVGINDSILEGGEQSTVASYREILRRLRTECPEAVIYAQSVLPVGPPFEGVNAWVRRVNREIAGMADGKAVIYVDMFDDFLAHGVLNPQYEVGDGVHLNGEGYQVWKSRIKGLVPAK